MPRGTASASAADSRIAAGTASAFAADTALAAAAGNRIAADTASALDHKPSPPDHRGREIARRPTRSIPEEKTPILRR